MVNVDIPDAGGIAQENECGLPGKGCLCDHPGPRLLLGQGQQNLLFSGAGLEGRVDGAVGMIPDL